MTMITQAHVLAGGSGSRLGVTDLPKSLLPLSPKNKPSLGFILDMLIKHGIDKLIITLPRKSTHPEWPKKITQYIEQNYREKFSIIKYLEARENIKESIIDARTLYDENVFLLAADIVTNINLGKIEAEHFKTNNLFSLTVSLVSGPDTKHHGLIVQTIKEDKLLPKNTHHEKKGWADSALYIIDKKFIKILQSKKHYHSAIDQVLKNKQVGIYKHKGYFFDINTKEKYLSAQKFITKNQPTK